MSRILFLSIIMLMGLLLSACNKDGGQEAEQAHDHWEAAEGHDEHGKDHEGHDHAEHGGQGEPAGMGDEHSEEKADDHDEHEHEGHGHSKEGATKHDDHEAGHDEHGEEGHDEHGHGGHEEGPIKLTAEQIKAADIGLAQAGPATIRETLSLYGAVVPNADRMQQVSARFPGVILQINKQVGDPVREGETLAVIESNESLESYPLKSRLSGVVTERNVSVGEQAGDRSLFVVADLSTVWVEVSVFPSDADKVRVGQIARIAHPKTQLQAEGKVIHVTPFGNRANQAQTARVALENPQQQWKPGIFVNAEIMLDQGTQAALAIHNDAVQTLENQSVVFVQSQEGFEARPVTLGRSDSTMSEVLKGLREGETYVSRNSFILKSELGKEGTAHEH